jgi:hypothetical protein
MASYKSESSEQFEDEIINGANDILEQANELAEGIDENAAIEPEDPCNSYEWSIIYILVLLIAAIVIVIQTYAMFRRRSELFSGFDIGIIAFFICTIIQFGPMTSQVLHAGHHVQYYTQSGCKILHYTDFGIRHVILANILALIIYAWLITRQNFNQEQVDRRIRDNIAWIILLAFGIEAVFGMPAAIFVDVLPKFPLVKSLILLLSLHCIALHCIALHCIALHCIALHCIALHCIALV